MQEQRQTVCGNTWEADSTRLLGARQKLKFVFKAIGGTELLVSDVRVVDSIFSDVGISAVVHVCCESTFKLLSDTVDGDEFAQTLLHSNFMEWMAGSICEQPNRRGCIWRCGYKYSCTIHGEDWDEVLTGQVPRLAGKRAFVENILDTLRKPNRRYANGKKVGSFTYSFRKDFEDVSEPMLETVCFTLCTSILERVCMASIREMLLAFCTGIHTRLGTASPVRWLDNDIIRIIAQFLLDIKNLEPSQLLYSM
jgi:hypothetical protein